MAIQNRRGTFTYYDPAKLLPGEFGVVQSGDPNTTSGAALYLAFSAGKVFRVITYEELMASLDAFTVSWADVSDKPPLDGTLSVIGAAADAAAVGQALSNMLLNMAPAYSSSKTYKVGDFCVHNRWLYQCTTAITTPESWTVAHWTTVKVTAIAEQMALNFTDSGDGNIVITKG